MLTNPTSDVLPWSAAAPLLTEQLVAFRDARRLGDEAAAWHALEWEHILSQPYMLPHLASHWHMLAYAVELRNWRESAGQALRLLLVPLGSLTGRLPEGNNGCASVSAFRPMPVPGALALRIEEARQALSNAPQSDPS